MIHIFAWNSIWKTKITKKIIILWTQSVLRFRFRRRRNSISIPKNGVVTMTTRSNRPLNLHESNHRRRIFEFVSAVKGWRVCFFRDTESVVSSKIRATVSNFLSLNRCRLDIRTLETSMCTSLSSYITLDESSQLEGVLAYQHADCSLKSMKPPRGLSDKPTYPMFGTLNI